MSFESNTGIKIQQAFELFHSTNPHVYELFKKAVFEAINGGKKKVSSKIVLGKIKWDMFISTNDDVQVEDIEGKKSYKINDAYTSRYSRLFAEEFPEHEDIFNYKELRS